MTTKTTTGYAQRDFNDTGTEQSFKAGDKVTVEDGVFANYLAAGLVGEKAPEPAAKAPATTDTKAKDA